MEREEKEIEIYAPSETEGALRQGEIITNLVQFKLSTENLNEDTLRGTNMNHPFAIVVSQDCDLAWDFKARQEQDHNTVPQHRLLPNVLFCETTTAENLRGREGMNSGLWKTIKGNKNERYHFLQKSLPEEDALTEGLPELATDFKRYFTIPAEEVYQRLANGSVRRCRLTRGCYELWAGNDSMGLWIQENLTQATFPMKSGSSWLRI